MRWYRVIPLIVIVVVLLSPAQVARGDSAPPWYAQGASVLTCEAKTNVQMMSEYVLIDIIELPEMPEPLPRSPEGLTKHGHLPAELMFAHVEATFVMRNQGSAEEAFEVWFPLGPRPGLSGSVANFTASVDGTPVPTGCVEMEDKWNLNPMGETWWATWPATFPPGHDVAMQVTYNVRPFSRRPIGRFDYVLQTGGGWHGPIGEGTIVIRFPHTPNETNAQLERGEEAVCFPCSDPFTLSGTEVTWRFSELEPTAGDNLYLHMLPPQIWREIVAARTGVEERPDSAEAHLRLARALRAGLRFKKILMEMWNTADLLPGVHESYRRALELDPTNVDICVEYLEFLRQLTDWSPPFHEDIPELLQRALELAPDDERLLEFQRTVATPRPTRTITPSPTDTPTRTPQPTQTATPQPSPTDVPTAVPTVFPLPSPFPRTPSPTPSPTVPPPTRFPTAPPPAVTGDGNRAGIFALGAILGIVLVGGGILLLRPDD
jgi:hypothetical protein